MNPDNRNISAESNESTDACLNDWTIAQLLAENLDVDLRQIGEEHLSVCTDCQRRLAQRAGEQSLDPTALSCLSPAKAGHESASLSATMSELKSMGPAGPFNSPCPNIDFLEPCDSIDGKEYLGKLSEYLIESVVGWGGMGIVFRAHEPSLDRTVALKVLTPSVWHQPESKQRFLREARHAASIESEYVVPIYQVDEFKGIPYFVMQFVHGKSLQQLVQEDGCLPNQELGLLIRHLAQGLSAAHEVDVIHRDIKPANILRCEKSNRYKITDFGLAHTANDPSLTQSGTIAGTPAFMSPEQANNLPLDARSDIFSLGSVLYFASTGKAPFTGNSFYSIIHQVCSQNPTEIERADLSPEFKGLVERLLRKTPDERFQSVVELHTRLDEIDRGSSPEHDKQHKAPSPSKSLLHHPASWLIGLAACGLVGMASLIGSGIMNGPATDVQRNSSGAKGIATKQFVDESSDSFHCTANGGMICQSIEAAVGICLPGNTIEIESLDGRPIFINSTINIRHDVTIIGKGTQVVEITGASEAIFRVKDGATLSLERVRLTATELPILKPPFTGEDLLSGAIVAIESGSFILNRGEVSTESSIAISALQYSQLKISNSIIQARDAVFTSHDSPSSTIEIENSQIAARFLLPVAIEDVSRPSPSSNISISNSILRGERLLSVGTMGGAKIDYDNNPNFKFEAVNNIFDIELLFSARRFAGKPQVSRSDINAKGVGMFFSWTGSENLFSNTSSFARVYAGNRFADPIETFDQWKHFNLNSTTNSSVEHIEFSSEDVGSARFQFKEITAPLDRMLERGFRPNEIGVSSTTN